MRQFGTKNKHGYKGVSRCGDGYRAVVCYRGEKIFLPVCKTPKDAHITYMNKVKELGIVERQPKLDIAPLIQGWGVA